MTCSTRAVSKSLLGSNLYEFSILGTTCTTGGAKLKLLLRRSLLKAPAALTMPYREIFRSFWSEGKVGDGFLCPGDFGTWSVVLCSSGGNRLFLVVGLFTDIPNSATRRSREATITGRRAVRLDTCLDLELEDPRPESEDAVELDLLRAGDLR